MKWPIDDMRRLTERDLFGAWDKPLAGHPDLECYAFSDAKPQGLNGEQLRGR